MVATRTVVGLEIHVQLRTATKMFCGCRVQPDAPPNSRVCPVCLGYPGALPVINRQAVHYALRVGLALHGSVPRRTQWDRKSYFYPDLPKNYQISQYAFPLASDGYFEIEANGQAKRIRIKRAHLEEDAGKNIHDVGPGTLVDLNRAGTPLLEIVTEPDLASADEAYAFCTELQRLMRHLGVSEANMQKGQMRFEPNVNVEIEQEGVTVRTPIVEIKNLNSFRAVRNAIAYESRRQIAAWREDPDYVLGRRPNENRGWNDERGVTEFQRGKEAAHDYRYFPDPDLAAVEIDEAMLAEIRSGLSELPLDRRRRFVQAFGLSPEEAMILVDDRSTAELFEEVVARGGDAKVAGKQFVNVWLKLAHDRRESVMGLGVKASRMAALANLTAAGTINKTAANKLAEVMLDRPQPPDRLAEELGLVQVVDPEATRVWVEEAFEAHAQAVQDALQHPKKAKAAAGFLRGQVMKQSGGKADPKLVGRLIEERLAQMKSEMGLA